MTCKFREEIVGKRFMLVSEDVSKLKNSEISEWSWRSGVIRAATHRDNNHPDLQVLVEFDDTQWYRREWITVYKDNLYRIFLVEKSLKWARRIDPFSSLTSPCHVLWPALTYTSLIAELDIPEESQPIEFLYDHNIAFTNYSLLKPFTEWNGTLYGVRDYPEVKRAARQWVEHQNGQKILLTTPSVLVGYRVEVYRAEGTTQWYTAVIVGYNETTRDLTVTDDTVLEDHNEDPKLVQMRLIGDGVVESIMKGEDIGITHRRSRSSATQGQNHNNKYKVRGTRGQSASNFGAKNVENGAPVNGRKPRARKLNAAATAAASNADGNQTQLETSGSAPAKDVKTRKRKQPPRESAAKKPPKQVKKRKAYKKKKLLEEANNSKLRREVEVRVEDCLQNAEALALLSKQSAIKEDLKAEIEEEVVCEDAELVQVFVQKDEESEPVSEAVICEVGVVSQEEPQKQEEEVTEEASDRKEDIKEVKTTVDDDKCNRMDLSDQVVNATSGHVVSLLQLHQLRNSIPDDRSDSGLSSLRSGSGDERSGSRSSALSSTDEQPVVTAAPQHLLSTSGNGSASSASSTSSQTHSANRSPLFAHSGVSPLDQVRVWRDPNLLLESEPHVRHVNRPIRRRDLSKSCNSFLSVQHQSLLMSHPSASASGGPPQTSSASAASLYPPAGAPNLISPHAHPSMHLPIAPVYLQDIWKHQQRYGGAHLLTPPTHTEELMERERAIIDRERMMMRERQHNELEKQKEKERQEREKHEREKQEKERQNQALQNHFEKSLRVAEQKQRGEQQWAPISGRPPQPRSSSMSEDDRKRAEQDLHQRHMTSMRADQRDHRSYYPPVQRPTNAPAKSEYPPPPAHSRGSSKADKVHPTMQKTEHGLYGYAAHHQQFFEPKSKAAAGSKTEVLPNPPPLVSEAKTVIVKHDTKNQHHLEQRGQIAHSPKMRSDLMQHYVQASNQAPKSGIYDYRSQASLTPSPHHHSEGQNSKSPGHHRASQLQSPHHPTQRHSPHGHPSQQQQHQQHSSPDMRYRSVSESQAMIYPTTKSSANYPAFLSATTAAYAMPAQQTAAANAKPKVSSPAPHHFYGKPNVPQTQLTAKPAASSPYQPASQYHPPHLQHAPPLNCLPPPAHSSRVDRYDQRLYSPGSLSRTSPPTAASAPVARSHAPYVSGVTPPPLPPHNVASVQTQPLDLGVANKYEAPAAAVSPKRKAAPCSLSPVCLEKKRKLDSPNQQQQQSLIFGGQQQQLQLSRVSEASPLIASAATTITTVVNAAAYRTPPVTVTAQPIAVTNNFPDLSVTAVNLEPRSVSPAANAEESPGTPVKTPNPAPPSSVDSEKSNSPGPSKTASNSNYPVRHLKKAWLQRHTGEDVEDTTGVVGSGSCVTLPLNIKPTATAIPAAPAKDKENPVNSIHSIGSMAVNSINKTKNYNKGGNKKAAKETPAAAANGHPTTESSNKADDSSSSDQERGRKSPPKRKPPKVKRKKGAKKASEEKKRKTGGNQSTVASESGSESEKESGSEKDSDSVASSGGGKKGAASGSNPPGGGKKRGRRPKSSKGEEPRAKKSKEDAPPQRDPFHKPPVGQLKKTGESFLQDGPCFEVAPKLAKCRECRWTPNQRSKNMPNIFCRFYAFRRLRYTKSGQLAIAGFSDPHKDALESDLKLWLPNTENPPADLDLETSRFLLKQVGDHFCDLLVQEKEAHAEHMSDDKIIAWKRVVQGVREMCDVCETTLFNFHWACGKCGFVVCLDCYKSRKSGTMKVWGEPGKDKDEFSWLLCTNRSVHEQEKLMLTQIIAGDSLRKLGRQVHEMRELWRVEQHCGCPQACPTRAHKQIADAILSEKANGFKKDLKKEIKEERSSPLSWLADVALSNEEKPLKLKEESSSSSDSEEGNFSTLRELLIRPSHKPNGSRATSPNPQQKSAKKINPKGDTLDDVISSVIEDSVPKAAETSTERKSELKHFVRRYNWQSKGRAPIPIRIMTLTESQILYPDVPHSWLCDGKLLRLSDPINKANYKIFQDQWRRGQPVIVSDVTKNLERDLWNPEAFARDFGEDKNDLINCMTGNLVPNQPMKKFWEGFDHFSKRLKDDRGNPMLLKLKDWPPGEDFAEMLPSRFNDLMQVLPLSEYTHRSGRLNLASRLPECFVRPDLGPKMYNAYGSALHPSKGTTNLHLDISDAVNVMVYVGIPKDGDSDVHIKEAFRAIDEAGCDILTRRRVRDKGELPGALWHIYNARDADKIRDLLNKVVVEKGGRLEPHHDPIHDQSCYLDGPLRERLYKEYGVEGYAIVQCLGDAVFIPAGAPHQVRNLHNCIKVAEDFVSPENVSHCFHLTQEFRDLTDTHSNHEDKLQIKNIIYHAVKDSLSTLSSIFEKHANAKAEDSSSSEKN